MVALNGAKRQKADKAVAMFFYAEGIPFFKARSPFFHNMISAVAAAGPSYKAPGYNALRTHLLDGAKRSTDTELAMFDKRSSDTGCSITSDGWTDAASHPLLNVLAVNPIGAKFLTAINTEGQVKSGLFIATELLQAIDMIGSERVVQVVTDGAANCTAAARIVKDR